MVGVHGHIVSIRGGDGGGSGTPAFDESNSPWGWINFRTTADSNMGPETRPVNQAGASLSESGHRASPAHAARTRNSLRLWARMCRICWEG